MTGMFIDQSSALTETLQSMRDVPGLQGSFVVSDPSVNLCLSMLFPRLKSIYATWNRSTPSSSPNLKTKHRCKGEAIRF
jgi:hypothetical protein